MLPEPVENGTEVLRVQIQPENILRLGGLHHLSQPGVRELDESLLGGLQYLSTNVQLHPGHLRSLARLGFEFLSLGRKM